MTPEEQLKLVEPEAMAALTLKCVGLHVAMMSSPEKGRPRLNISTLGREVCAALVITSIDDRVDALKLMKMLRELVTDMLSSEFRLGGELNLKPFLDDLKLPHNPHGPSNN